MYIQQECALHARLFHSHPGGQCRPLGQRSVSAVYRTHYWPQWDESGGSLWPLPESQAPQRLNAVPLYNLLTHTQCKKSVFEIKIEYSNCVSWVSTSSPTDNTSIFSFSSDMCRQEMCWERNLTKRAEATGWGRGSVQFGLEVFRVLREWTKRGALVKLE